MAPSIPIKSRQYLRQRLTKICGRIDREFDDLDEQDKTDFIDRIKEIREDIVKLDKQIFSLLLQDENTDEGTLNKHEDENDHYRQLCKANITRLESSLEIDNSLLNSPNLPLTNRLKLPDVPLPTFKNSRDESFEKFIHVSKAW